MPTCFLGYEMDENTTGSNEFSEFISAHGISLQCEGLYEVGLTTEHALQAVAIAAASGIPILGGDVWWRRDGEIVPALMNWSTNHAIGESEADYSRRSWEDSARYLSKLPRPDSGEYLIVIVTP